MAFLKIKNRAFSTLASGVSDSDTSWTVATGEGAKFPTTGDFHVTCEDEIVKCTSRSTDVLTVVRAQEGTSNVAHVSGKAVELRVTAGVVEEIQNVLDGGVGKTHLSQDFGASATRLRNLIVEPIAGEIVRMLNCAASPFSAVINGNPTATSVVYDGEANENMLNGLASGAGYWGRIILHNTTRSNSRKIVSVDIGTNTITTESSTDDWANNDVVTCQSQTNVQTGYIDVDVSAEVPATTDSIFIFAAFQDNENNSDDNRALYFHPYEAYDAGKRQWVSAKSALDAHTLTLPLKIISQKFTMLAYLGCVDVHVVLAVKASVEFADT